MSLDITHEIQDFSGLALATAADHLVDKWEDDGYSVSPTVFVRETFAEVSRSLASRLFGILEDLAGELNQTLEETAEDLDFKDVNEKEGFNNALKELPTMDLGIWEVNLTPGFLVKLSKHMATKRIEQKLREQIGASISKAFYNFGKALDTWARRALRELELRFDAHADTYRAHLARLNSGKQASETEELFIRRDLERLTQFQTGAASQTFPAS
jgi:hypothetical protein